MPQEESQGFCNECEANTLIRRQTPNHLVHGVVTLFLCGLWLPVWIIVAATGYSPWRCTRCGSASLSFESDPAATGPAGSGGSLGKEVFRAVALAVAIALATFIAVMLDSDPAPKADDPPPQPQSNPIRSFPDPVVVADPERERKSRMEFEARRKWEEEANKPDEKRILGRWKVVKAIDGGKEYETSLHTWTFFFDKVYISGHGPMEYNLFKSWTPSALRIYTDTADKRVTTFSCNYKFEGDKLIVCLSAGDDQPKGFSATGGETSLLLTLTRPE